MNKTTKIIIVVVSVILSFTLLTSSMTFVWLAAMKKEEPPAPPAVCKITFDIGYKGVKNPPEQKVNNGKFATMPTIEKREGYQFAGWFLDKESMDWTKPFDFAKTPIKDHTTLYAIWVDMKSDSDGDGLSDDIENFIKTDKNDVDSDGDGLNDYLEKIDLGYDPNKVDSDNNGVDDPDEDYDDDGLVNIDEIEYNTSLIIIDSDSDGLSDGDEVDVYSTLPDTFDTDGDEAGDGDEVAIGSDPLVSNNSFKARAISGEISDAQPIALEVTTQVSGEQLGTLQIEPVTYSENPYVSPTAAGYLGTAFDITIDGEIDSAELTFTYDTALGSLSSDFQPRIYYFNEEAQTFEELPNQKVSEGRISTTVSHFSTYLLLNKIEFDLVWTANVKKPILDSEGVATHIDVAFVVDTSGSMRNDRISTARTALNSFLSALEEKDRAALVKFSSYATTLTGLTDDKDYVKNYVSGLYVDGLTAMYEGLDNALDILTTEGDDYGYTMIIVLSDGYDEPSTTYSSYYSSLVNKAINNDIVIYTIGVGDSVDTSILTQVAYNTGGEYYHAAYASEIVDAFKKIQEETVDLTTDSNEDKIPDYFNEKIKTGELPLSNGSLEFMGYDFNYDENGNPSADFDGDGVLNGDELIITHLGERVYMTKKSDPTMEYSDTDQYPDVMEHEMGTNPMVHTYPASFVDKLLDDSQYIYTDVYKEESKWYNSIARNIWSTVSMNWSHQDEAKKLLANFFKDYYNLDTITKVSDQVEKEMAAMMGEYSINQLINFYKLEEGVVALEEFAEQKQVIKKWISSGNSMKNLGASHFGQFKGHLKLFDQYTGMSKFDFKGISKFDKFTMGLTFTIKEGQDIYGYITAYSSLVATQAAFKESEDILTYIANNPNPAAGYSSVAAKDLLLVVQEKREAFMSEATKDFALATTENVADLGLNILSAANPYVLAITTFITAADLIFSLSEIGDNSYCLYVIDDIVTASRNLFSPHSKTGDFYNMSYDQIRYLKTIAFARLQGGLYANQIIQHQTFWGEDDAEVREVFKDAVDANEIGIMQCLNVFLTT